MKGLFTSFFQLLMILIKTGKRPFCLACMKLGLVCPGYQEPLRWVQGIASRGRFAGAAFPGENNSTAGRQLIPRRS